jgi:hypothetical protein
MTDDFAQYVLQSNPFAANAVNDPSGAEVDVQSIHGRQFEELVRHAEEAHRQRGHLGQIVWGEPGIGKSHLLARLCRWADRQQGACCIFLHNIQPDPESLPRYVLKCVIHRLILGRERGFHGTTLYWLMTRFIRRALERFPVADRPPKAKQARDASRRLVDEVLRESPNAGVDALQAVVGDARSGDVEVDLPGGQFRRLAEEEVIASHQRQNRYRRHRLLGQLLARGRGEDTGRTEQNMFSGQSPRVAARGL